MTVTDALEKYLLQLEADGRSPHTIGQYRRHIRLLVAWLAGDGHSTQVEEIDHQVVARFLAAPQARSSAHGGQKHAASVNALRSSLKTFFAYLHRAGYIAEDPGRLIRRANCASGPPKALTLDEREKLLSTLVVATGPEAERDHVLFHLMLASGIRLSAALGLDVDNLDLAAGEITIRTKGDRTERVYLGQAIAEHLRRYVGGSTSGPLFVARTGERVTHRQVQRRLDEWAVKAGIHREVSPHSLRHTFAMGLYQKTGDILLVKTALHHRSIASTLVYARATSERLREALA